MNNNNLMFDCDDVNENNSENELAAISSSISSSSLNNSAERSVLRNGQTVMQRRRRSSPIWVSNFVDDAEIADEYFLAKALQEQRRKNETTIKSSNHKVEPTKLNDSFKLNNYTNIYQDNEEEEEANVHGSKMFTFKPSISYSDHDIYFFSESEYDDDEEYDEYEYENDHDNDEDNDEYDEMEEGYESILNSLANSFEAHHLILRHSQPRHATQANNVNRQLTHSPMDIVVEKSEVGQMDCDKDSMVVVEPNENHLQFNLELDETTHFENTNRNISSLNNEDVETNRIDEAVRFFKETPCDMLDEIVNEFTAKRIERILRGISLDELENVLNSMVEIILNNNNEILVSVMKFLAEWPELNNSLKLKMFYLIKLLENRKLREAYEVQASISFDYSREASRWMHGIKKLIEHFIFHQKYMTKKFHDK